MTDSNRQAGGETGVPIKGSSYQISWSTGAPGGAFGELRLRSLIDKIRVSDINQLRQILDGLIQHTHSLSMQYSVPNPLSENTTTGGGGGGGPGPAGTGNFPDRVQIRKGDASTGAVLFSSAFTNGCLAVVLTPTGPGISGCATTYENSGFMCMGAGGTYIAIGY